MKHVKFNEDRNVTNIMYTWSYAYKRSRISDWEVTYLDSLRFKNRIKYLESKLQIYLTLEYRNKVYTERFVNR